MAATYREHSQRTRRSVQLVAGLGSTVAPFLVASMVVAAPTIGADLGAGVALLPWLTAAFFLVAASLLIPMGRVADMSGSKRVFTLGIVVYLVSTMMCALAPNMEVLIIGRGLTGMGAAMVFGTSIALLSLVFPERDRAQAIGINVSFMTVGFITGMLAGGLLSFYLSWRYLFVIAFILAVIDMYLLRTAVKGECELSPRRTIDPLGMTLFIGGLLTLFYGLSGVLSTVGRISLLVSAVVLAALYWWERSRPDPIIGPRVLRAPSFLPAIITNILFQAGAFAVPFLLSLHLQFIAGLDARVAGIVLLGSQVPTSILSMLSGRLNTRWGKRPIVLVSGTLVLLGLALLLAIDDGTPVAVLLVSLALVGSGAGLFMPTVVNWALGTIGREDYGVVTAASETARLAGMALSNVIMIILLAVFLGSASVGEENNAAFLYMLKVCATVFMIMTAMAMVPALVLKKEGFGSAR